MNLYDAGRFSRAHELVVDAVEQGSRVLEMGANTGYLTERLNSKGCQVTATEFDKSCLETLQSRAARTQWCDLNDWSTLGDVRHDQFDTVIYADVLEHLLDPVETLAKTLGLVGPGGSVVVSMPNVAFYAIRIDLLRGRFEREDTGILDRTHLHFFTLKSAEAMFREAGWTVRMRHVAEDVPLDTKLSRLSGGSRGVKNAKDRFNVWAGTRWPELFGYQFVWVLEPS